MESGTPDNLRRTIECSERATAADPAYAYARAFPAECYSDSYVNRVNIVPDPLDRALAAALKGVQADPMSQQAHWGLALDLLPSGRTAVIQGGSKGYFGAESKSRVHRGDLGWALAHAGEWDQGIALIEKAYELNPHGPRYWLYPVAWNHYRLGDYEQALLVANKIKQPGLLLGSADARDDFGQLGRTQEAKAALADALALKPDLRETIREHVTLGSSNPN